MQLLETGNLSRLPLRSKLESGNARESRQMVSECVGKRTEDPVEKLARWGEIWTMIDGRIVCICCGNFQLPSRAEYQFVHDPCCKNERGVNSRPWKELNAILSLCV